MPFVFSGCTVIGEAEEVACGFVSGKDQDHCYQDAAKRKESFETCAKIKAETFTAMEGPATRDKCYLQVAEKTGDASGCEKIEGGMISYTKEECYIAAAKTAKDKNICNSISGDETAKQNCLNQVE